MSTDAAVDAYDDAGGQVNRSHNGFVSLQCGALRHHACPPSVVCACTCHPVADAAISEPVRGSAGSEFGVAVSSRHRSHAVNASASTSVASDNPTTENTEADACEAPATELRRG